MRTRWLLPLLIGCGMLATGAARANGSASGVITYFIPFVYNGVEMVAVRLTTMSNVPVCGTANRFVMSSSDPKYKTVIAMLLGAHFSGSPIFIHGQGTCSNYVGSEDLAYACLGPDPC
jgi:hypothetical protein